MATHHPEQIIQANGIDICTDAYGDPGHPAILLIMGASASMLLWEENFCQQLADGGRFVVRFDNRDVGRTTCCPMGQPNYSLQDMADDAVAVLDHYGIDRAHICGASMGGMIAQLVGLNHPQRVLSLIPIMSSPDPAAVTDPMEGKTGMLSPPTAQVMAMVAAGAMLDWSDPQAVLENRLRMFGVLAGSAYPYDADSRRALFRREIERANDMSSSQNHGLVVGLSERWIERLGAIQVPVLVIHGDDDPILPLDHGQALADSVQGAQLLIMPGVGHEIPEQELPRVIPAILEFTA
jgi:pimeloyl-ACP methyl ester carboxylesterase